MTTKHFLLSAILLIFSISQAQQILNAKSPEEYRKSLEKKEEKEKDEPLPYPEINERNIAWSKTVSEIVDLNEKFNQIYYFNNNDLINPKKSLYQALIEGIKEGDIKEVYDDENFKIKMTQASFEQKSVRIDTTDTGKEILNQGGTLTDEYIDRYEIKSKDVKIFKIKGMWYMDRRIGEMRYRLLAIAPMGPDIYQLNKKNKEDLQYVDLFWVWYPDARKKLHRVKVLTSDNPSSTASLDELLNVRRFTSVIYKESNLYGDRSIEDYIPEDAQEQIYESQRIKENIRQKEEEMWNP